MFEDIKERIEKHIAQFLDDFGLEIFEFSIEHRNKTVAITLLVDHIDGGVDVDECSFINKKIAHFIEDEQLLKGEYTIEVSSPGLDRPLTTEKDFIRVKGKKVKFHLKEKIENKLEYDGVVQEIDSDEVMVETKKKPIKIPLQLIQKAVQII